MMAPEKECAHGIIMRAPAGEEELVPNCRGKQAVSYRSFRRFSFCAPCRRSPGQIDPIAGTGQLEGRDDGG